MLHKGNNYSQIQIFYMEIQQPKQTTENSLPTSQDTQDQSLIQAIQCFWLMKLQELNHLHSLWHSSPHLCSSYRISEDQLPLVWVWGVIFCLFLFKKRKKNRERKRKSLKKTKCKKPQTPRKPFLLGIAFLPTHTFSLPLSFSYSVLLWKAFPILVQFISLKKLKQTSNNTNSYKKRNHTQLWKLIILEASSLKIQYFLWI